MARFRFPIGSFPNQTEESQPRASLFGFFARPLLYYNDKVLGFSGRADLFFRALQAILEVLHAPVVDIWDH